MTFGRIKLGAILIAIANPLLAEDIELECISINEQLARSGKQLENSVLLLDSAFTSNNCPSKSYWSIENSMATSVEGLTILHGSTEDMNRIRSFANSNRKILSDNLPETIKNSKNNIKGDFADANLSAYSSSIRDICRISIKLKRSRNNKLWVVSSEPIPLMDYCLSAGVILAGHGVELTLDNGRIAEKTPNTYEASAVNRQDKAVDD